MASAWLLPVTDLLEGLLAGPVGFALLGFVLLWDPLYFVFVGPAFILGMIAQGMVRSAFHRWSQVATRSGLTGAEVAARVLSTSDIRDVGIEISAGMLSDHYDPRTRTLRLSEQNYHGRSVAAAAIAAHEAGHAIQHARKYAPLALRSMYVPLASLGSGLSFPLLFAGFIFAWKPLVLAGVALFSAVVLFQILTLPVEFDASRRAKRVLIDGGMVTDDEEARGVSKVLNAAALTYVAATLQAVLTLLYYLHILGLLGRRS